MPVSSMAVARVQSKLLTLSERAGRPLPAPQRKALTQLLYGLVTRGSPLLSDGMRALDESVQPKKTIERLGRHLGREALGEAAWNAVLRDLPRHMSEDSVIAVDPTDVAKPHARKMERLARVKDGSTGEITQGYWAVAVALATPGSKQWLPLALELYSQEGKVSRDWSENHELLRVVRRIMEASGGRGTLVIDRGGDRKTLMRPFLDAGYDFVIRQRGDRHVSWRGRKVEMRVVAKDLKCPTKVRSRRGKRRQALFLGSTTVRLPDRPDHPLSLVVVKGGGADPLMLLTTHLGRGGKHRARALSMYRTRWRVEEMIRFTKQRLDWENIRVRRWGRLKSLTRLICLAAYFLATRLGMGRGEAREVRLLVATVRPIYEERSNPLWAATRGLQRLFMARGPPHHLRQRAA